MSYETLSETEWEAGERVWDLLDEGKTERARVEMDALLESRPGHPDLRITDAAVALDEGEAEHALIALQGAEQSADPPLFFHLRAATHYELAELEAAREDGYRALTVNPEIAETHALLAKTLEYLGDAEAAGDAPSRQPGVVPGFLLDTLAHDRSVNRFARRSGGWRFGLLRHEEPGSDRKPSLDGAIMQDRRARGQRRPSRDDSQPDRAVEDFVLPKTRRRP